MSEKVTLIESDDFSIERARQFARATFKYFWRELYWERRRIIPGLDLSAIKLPFEDEGIRNDGNPEVEHMWVDDVMFDGYTLSGVLMSSPNWISSVAHGDFVRAPIDHMDDWLFAVGGVAYGGFTIQAIRAKMEAEELADHDGAWGLDFAAPDKVRLTHKEGEVSPSIDLPFKDHPMCLNCLEQIENQLSKNPQFMNEPDERGWLLLHHEAMAGNMAIIQILLKHGCDVNAKTRDGQTAADLAAAIGWMEICDLLHTRSA